MSGEDGAPGAPGKDAVAGPIVLGPGDELPGVVLRITQVSGGSGANGNLKPGDVPSVTFTVKTKNGTALGLEKLASASILLSGPTQNYQRVIAAQSNLLKTAVTNADGSYTYQLPAIPTTYLPPLNDSASLGRAEGELQGDPLLSGTYTVGLQAYATYVIEGKSYRDAGNATFDVLLGDATVLAARQVVKGESCNQCHSKVQAHGGSRNDVQYCLLCHTAGSEDKNVATVAGGTPGVTVDFGVMVHKLHGAAHLPSVLGVSTNADGTRKYDGTPLKYEMVGYGNAPIDFSDFTFPVMPSAYAAFLFDKDGSTYMRTGGNGPMPRDVGYAALSGPQRLLEDKLRTGLVACDKCHGDPDGAGALTAAAQAEKAFSTVTRKACGSCHEDIDWNKPYTANGQTMPPQTNDTACVSCHTPEANRMAHLHPYSNPALNTGLNIALASVSGGSGTNGRHKSGDPVEVTFSVKDDAGADILLRTLTRFQAMVVGPTSNPQVVLPAVLALDTGFRKSSPFTGNGTISAPTFVAGAGAQTVAVVFTSATSFDVVGTVSGALTGQSLGATSGSQATVEHAGVRFTLTQGTTPFAAGDRWYFESLPLAPSYTLQLPLDLSLERLGAADGAEQTLTAANVPLLWGRQVVFERTAIQAGTALQSEASVGQRFVVVDAALAGVVLNDRVVIDDGQGTEEYLDVGRIQTTHDVTGADLGAADRIWFKAPLRFAHGSGAALQKVTLSAKREGVAYHVTDAASGQLRLVAGQFTAGNPVVMNYRTVGRFGWKPAAGLTRNTYLAAAADSEEIDLSWGDWRDLPLLDGTYTVGFWAHKDFTVTPARTLTTTEAWDKSGTDNTTYRMISPPATKNFLFGAATTLVTRKNLTSMESCNDCHGDLQAHGNGRRGLETCLMCHSSPGIEDGPLYSYSGWTGVNPTPGVTMDFRVLIHKVHMGKERTDKNYVANGVFLGVPYPVKYEGGFPSMPGGAKDCAACHGEKNTAYLEPDDRLHPAAAGTPARSWNAACGSCHDSPAASTHIAVQTYLGNESCAVCHGPGREASVELVHKVR